MNQATKVYLTATGTLLPAFILGAGVYMMGKNDLCMFKDKKALIAIGVGAIAGYLLTRKLLK